MGFVDAISHIRRAFNKIQEQTNEARAFLHDVIKDTEPRLTFHLGHALAAVQQMMKLNFERGWDVMDDRTFSHVTSQFYETVNTYDRTIKQLLTPDVTEQLQRQVSGVCHKIWREGVVFQKILYSFREVLKMR